MEDFGQLRNGFEARSFGFGSSIAGSPWPTEMVSRVSFVVVWSGGERFYFWSTLLLLPDDEKALV
jgi:hypothetical protein